MFFVCENIVKLSVLITQLAEVVLMTEMRTRVGNKNVEWLTRRFYCNNLQCITQNCFMLLMIVVQKVNCKKIVHSF